MKNIKAAKTNVSMAYFIYRFSRFKEGAYPKIKVVRKHKYIKKAINPLSAPLLSYPKIKSVQSH